MKNGVDSENINSTEMPGAGGNAETATEQDTEVDFTDTESAEGTESGAGTDGKDAGKAGGEEGEGTPGNGGKTRDRKRDAEEARQRRERERQEAVNRADTAAVIEALGGKNPYTGDEMKDAEDVAAWRRMKRIEARGGDPVKEYARETASEARQRAGEEADRQARADEAVKDWNEFVKANPGMSWDKLSEDEGFVAYAEGKLGRKPLTEIYAGYQKLVGRYTKQASEAEESAVQRAAQAIANGMASPGSATGESGDEGGSDFLTLEQVAAMTPRQIAENYDRVWKSQQRWKEKG